MNKRFSEQSNTTETPKMPEFQKRLSKHRSLFSSRFFTLGGSLLTVLMLLGTVGVMLALRSHQPAKADANTTAADRTPASLFASVPRGSLYTVSADGLTRVDLRTGKAQWTLDVTDPSTPLIVGDRLFFNSQDSSGNYLLEAVSTNTGKKIWSSQQYSSGFLLGSKNMLYDSTCDFSASGFPCRLYGINAGNGEQVWSYDLPQGNAWIALNNNVLYGVSYISYFALNASNGTPLWQKDLLQYTDQEANMTPIVSGNVLSFASCNVTKQSSGFPGCYLYAFNASTGDELWHVSSSDSILAPPTIMHGVVYAGTIGGTIYAIDEQSGASLWNTNIGGTLAQVRSSDGLVYIEVIGSDGQTFSVEALDVATHTLRWGENTSSTAFALPGQPSALLSASGATIPLLQRLPISPLSAGPAAHPFILDHGLIYILTNSSSIDVFRAIDGKQVKHYPVSSGYGFTVATA